MSEQQDNPKRSVVVPILIAVLALAAFAYAFYAFDGMALVSDLMGSGDSGEVADLDPGGDEPDAASSELQLPEGMTEEFALRIWQEQIDSQANIKLLVDGEIERLVIDDVVEGATEATLAITAEFADGSSAPGNLGMRRFGDVWYIAFVSGMRGTETGGLADNVGAGKAEPPSGDLPELDDVDVPLLNTILEQQALSAEVLEEYATGVVRDVRVDEVVAGTGNTTLKIVMNENHEEGNGQVVVVSKIVDGKETWFIARFTKDAVQ